MAKSLGADGGVYDVETGIYLHGTPPEMLSGVGLRSQG